MTDLHYDHMHFVGSEGSNFGLTLGGVFSESLPDLNNYQVEAPSIARNILTGQEMMLMKRKRTKNIGAIQPGI